MPRFLRLLLLLLAPTTALADTLSTFSLNATITDSTGNTGQVTGTVTIDRTTDSFAPADFQISYLGATYLFNTTNSTFSNPAPSPTTFLGVFDDTSGGIFQLGLPTSSLSTYTGSGICTQAAPCPFRGGGFVASGFLAIVPGNNFIPATSGSLTTATPEPASLLLVSLGIVGIAGKAGKIAGRAA